MKRLKVIINPENVSTARSVLMKTVKSQLPTVDATKALVLTKINDINAFYKHVTGLDELEYYQDRVIELQDSLLEAQLKRREMGHLLRDLRDKGQEVQDRIHKVKRHEEPGLFLELMREETEFIKRERDCYALLNDQERHEREVFTAFSNAIRDSQEKQRTRLEYTKYIGFGLTLVGALASYAITTWRTEDLKKVIKNTITDDVKNVIEMTVAQIGMVNTEHNQIILGEIAKKQLANEEKLWAQIGNHQLENTHLRKAVEGIVVYLNERANKAVLALPVQPVPPTRTEFDTSALKVSVIGALVLVALMSCCCQ